MSITSGIHKETVNHSSAQEKLCSKCGRLLPVENFYLLKSGYRHAYCKECERRRGAEKWRKKHPFKQEMIQKPNGVWMVKSGGHLCTRWTENMLSLMRRHYPNTSNNEMAELLGVPKRTLQSKAKAMGLSKSREYILSLKRESLMMAHVRNRELGYPGKFRPRNEKGHFLSKDFTEQSV